MSSERPENGHAVPEQEVPTENPSLGSFSELRNLLFGEDQQEIRRIQQRLDDPKLHAEDISRILPEAIALRQLPDMRLADALAPTLQESFRVSIKKDPQALVDAISPVMAPAIRKSISDALQRMIQSLNQTLEYGFSAKGWKWRWEAYRTGKPFAEVVLLNTLKYRVEQVFLIHRKTGLLLQHVSADPVVAHDADMVSGMLTAIQDFIRDSFGGSNGHALDQACVGDLTIWVEQTRDVFLAAAIRGNPIQGLRTTLQETVEKIQIDLRQQLEAFDGNAAPFESSRPILETCLVSAAGSDEKTDGKASRKVSPALLIVSVAVLALVGTWVFFSYRSHRRWTTYLDRLAAEPGIVLTGSGKRHGSWYVEGLRDPLAVDPSQLARTSGLDPKLISSRWELYDSFAPGFVLARANTMLRPPAGVLLGLRDGFLRVSGSAPGAWIADARRLAPLLPGVSGMIEDELRQSDRPEVVLRAATALLNPPAEVSLSYTDGVLKAEGSASHEWRLMARSQALTVPGVKSYDDDRLVDHETRYWLAEVNRIDSITFDFQPLGTDLLPGQESLFAEAADAVRKLASNSPANASPLQVMIIGHARPSGNASSLNLKRAERVKAELVYLGASASMLVVDTMDDAPARRADGYVSFQVVGSRAPTQTKAAR